MSAPSFTADLARDTRMMNAQDFFNALCQFLVVKGYGNADVTLSPDRIGFSWASIEFAFRREKGNEVVDRTRHFVAVPKGELLHISVRDVTDYQKRIAESIAARSDDYYAFVPQFFPAN